MAVREDIIQLSLSIQRLRQTIAEEEAAQTKRRAELAALERHLDQVVMDFAANGDETLNRTTLTKFKWEAADLLRGCRAAEPTSAERAVDHRELIVSGFIADWHDSAGGEGEEPPVSVTEQVRKFFVEQPYLPYGPAEVRERLSLPEARDTAVRQALRRLCEHGFLTRASRGLYQLNPVRPKEEEQEGT